MCDLKPPKQIVLVFGLGQRGFTALFGVLLALSLSAGLSSCATKTAKKPQLSPSTQHLPKPAAIRVAQDTSNKRKPPLMPKTIVKIKPETGSDIASAEQLPVGDTKTVDSTTPKFINNEQPQDFFQGAADAPVGETVLGSFFDSIFRPATPPNQPVSSTSYTVQ
jgi:hypothetical protein